MRTKVEPFEKHAPEYEAWFEKNRYVYESELMAIKRQLPKKGEGVEIGVGSGRFAAPLGIKLGVEPSGKMREYARSRGVEALDGVAEKVPLANCLFSFVLMVTTICFLDDTETALKEVYRILKGRGHILIGFIDNDSPVGILYQRHKNESVFYKAATFHSVNKVSSYLKTEGIRSSKPPRKRDV
jgi:SAM-dependent methyltransferase